MSDDHIFTVVQVDGGVVCLPGEVLDQAYYAGFSKAELVAQVMQLSVEVAYCKKLIRQHEERLPNH